MRGDCRFPFAGTSRSEPNVCSAQACTVRAVIRLVATDQTVILTDDQVMRARYQLLEFIPATKVAVRRGPGVMIDVPGHSLDELAPAILRAVEDAVGCTMIATEAILCT